MPMFVIPIVMAAFLGACGAPDNSQENRVSEDEQEQEHGHLRDAARAPLDKARAVEDISAGRGDQIDDGLETAGDQ